LSTVLTFPAPFAGSDPQLNAVTAEYIAGIVWSQNGSAVTGKFQEGKEYSAIVTLVPNPGYGFTGDEVFTHPQASNILQEFRGSNCIVTLFFPPTSHSVFATNLPVDAPVAGNNPQLNVNTAEYNGTVIWRQNGATLTGKFLEGKEYSAVVTLIPNGSYHFTGKEVFTHPQASSILQDFINNNWIVNLYFPSTFSLIRQTDLSAIAAPVAGNTPQLSYNTSEYNSMVSWNHAGEAVAGSFLEEIEYTAVVTLTPVSTYRFTGTETFAHKSALSAAARFVDNTAVVTLNFPVIPASDVNFLSITGERYEKYLFQVDPALLDRIEKYNYSGESKPSSPYTMGTTYPVPDADSFSFEIPLRYLIEPGQRLIHFKGSYYYGWSTSGIALSIPRFREFDTDYSFNLVANPLYEEYDVLKTFSGGSLKLPKTEGYSNAYYVNKYHTYQFEFTKAQLIAISPPSDLYQNNPNAAFLDSYPGVISLQTFDRYTLASRNFYQYKSMKITYPAGTALFGISSSSVVNAFAYDPASNSITVVFNEYNAPYTGEVLKFYFFAPDGTLREKVISVGD
jgi:hypothetical protein